MVTRDTAWAEGTPCWVDLGVADIPRAKQFYTGLFGWQITDGPPESGGYAMCEIGGRPVAGIGPKMSPAEVPASWTTYLATDDADATGGRIKAAGGQLMMDPYDVMDVGRMAIATDPGGAVFGLWQARAHTGIRLANAAGALIWNENMSRNYGANRAFYGAVFGYSFGDIGAEGMNYATLDLDGKPVGGIGELGADQPAQTPASWATYFGVSDTDAAIGRAVGLGGSLIAPAWDSPYGRMAVVSDDQGAVFALMSVSEEQDN
jgi:uncharacterized protein